MSGNRRTSQVRMLLKGIVALTFGACVCASIVLAQGQAQRSFPTAEDAVKALVETVKAGNLDAVLAIFGPGGQELIDSSDAATARQNQKIFTVAVGERWHLEDTGADRKTLVIGNEDWPFPVPIVKDGNAWRFDGVAGKEEILARRVGRNELAAIDTARAYVTAQKRYAEQGHDGKAAGLYAGTFQSDQGKQNGLFWPATKGQPLSPLGDLVAQAAAEGRQVGQGAEPTPLYGYYFKILSAQGAAATGGARSYIVKGDMSGGFALVAWPAQYDVTGVMTFIVNQDGVVHEKDLGAGTDAAARQMTTYNPDSSWRVTR